METKDSYDDDRYIDDHAQIIDKLLDDIIISSIQKAQSKGVSKLFLAVLFYV